MVLVCLVLSAGCGSDDGQTTSLSGKAKGMNVVVIVADTLRADRLSTYGYDRRTSPQLDELAKTGVRFDNAFVQCNFSGGSYASIFSGLYPFNHGVRDHPMNLEDALPTLAESFKAEGYTTFGRHSHRLLVKKWNYNQGFDDYEIRPSGPAAVQDTVQFLKRVGDEPFFAFLQFMDPHFPYRPPGEFRTVFGKAPEGFEQRHLEKARNHQLVMFGYELLGFEPEDRPYFESLYDGEILYTDAMMGKVVETLQSQGLLENTLIVFTSDHGESMGEHGTMFNHDSTLYDEILRVPLVLSSPKLFPEGRVIEELVREIDIFPSLVDLIGAKKERVDGKSVLSILDGEKEGRLAFAEGRPLDGSRVKLREAGIKASGMDPIPHYRMRVPGNEGKWRSVRDATHKLIFVPGVDQPHWELYDLTQDPGEQKNLFGQIAGENEKKLMKDLMAWIDEDPGGGSVVLDEASKEALIKLGYMAEEDE